MTLRSLRKGESGLYLYEMIQISDCGHDRTRVWRGLCGGRRVMRTLTDERKASDRWIRH